MAALVRQLHHAPNFDIEIPSRTVLDIKTGGGHIEVDDIKGNTKLRRPADTSRSATSTGCSNAETSGGHIALKNVIGDSTSRPPAATSRRTAVKGKLHAETRGATSA
jgi:hypothetical protein